MKLSLVAALTLTASTNVLSLPLNTVGSQALALPLVQRQTNDSSVGFNPDNGQSSGSEPPVYGIPTGENTNGSFPGTDGTNLTDPGVIDSGSITNVTTPGVNNTTIIPDASLNGTTIVPSANGTLTVDGLNNSTNSTNTTLSSNGINPSCGQSCVTSDSILNSCWNISKDPEVVAKCFCSDTQAPPALSSCTSSGANCSSNAAASLSQACTLFSLGQGYQAGLCYASQNPSSADCQGKSNLPASPLSGTTCQNRGACNSFEATLKSCVSSYSTFLDGAKCLFTSPTAYSDLNTCLADPSCSTDDMAMIKAAFDTYNNLNGPAFYSSVAPPSPTSTASNGAGGASGGANGNPTNAASANNVGTKEFVSIIFQSSFCMTSGNPNSAACKKPQPVSEAWQRTYQEKTTATLLIPATTTKKTASITEARGGNLEDATINNTSSSGALGIHPSTLGTWVLALAVSAGFVFLL